MVSIDQAIDECFLSNRHVRKIKEFVVGVYEINGFQLLALSLSKKDEIEEEFENDEWDNLQRSITQVATHLNNDDHLSDQPHKNLLSWIVYLDDKDDEYARFEFSVVEPVENAFDIKTVRRLFKENFGKYRITQSKEIVPTKSFITSYYRYRNSEEQLTRRIISVTVPKQEITYHMLVGKFKKYNLTD